MEVAEQIPPHKSVDAPPVRRKIQVAIVGPSLRYVGGQSVQVELLLRHWRDDPDVEATFIPIDPEFPRGLRWVRRIPVLRTIVRTPFYLVALWRGMRDVDIAHIFSASYSSFVIAPFPAWLIAKLRGKRTLINYHSGEARNHLSRSRFARAILKRVTRIVSPSGYLVDVFRGFGLEAQSVPNMADFSQFRFRERIPLRPHLVCTRGFHPYYCVDVVIRAFAIVKQSFPDAQLDLVGGGALEGEMRRLVSQLQLGGVNFCGVASRDNIGSFYDRADIFINGSRLDNMPVSILEAFAAGTPVISTAPEGMRCLVEDGCSGLLSPVEDAAALAANVVRVLRDPQLAERLSSNAFRELDRYRWEAVRQQWLRAYREMMPELCFAGMSATN